MANFSGLSHDRLLQCHPELQLLFNTVIQNCDCTVIAGHRNKEDQEKAVREGKSKLGWPNSKHNVYPSLAADVVPYPIDWNNTKQFIWFGGYVLGVADLLYQQGRMAHRIRWGGDFNNNYDVTDDKGLIDLPHFELIIT